MQIRHELSPAYRQHVSEVLAQIRQGESTVLALKGRIYAIEQDVAVMRKHLSVVLDLAARADGAPESSKPYTLSADGTALIGEKEETNVA